MDGFEGFRHAHTRTHAQTCTWEGGAAWMKHTIVKPFGRLILRMCVHVCVGVCVKQSAWLCSALARVLPGGSDDDVPAAPPP